MNAINLVTIDFVWDAPDQARWSPFQLRGALGRIHPGEPLFHQHDESGNVLYRYPRVHYRRTRRGAQVVGFGQAIQALTTISWPGLVLRLGRNDVTIRDVEYCFHRHQVAIADELIRYQFGSPWLPFNQKTHQRYCNVPTRGQPAERDRLARAGLLMSLKQLDVWIQERVFAAVEITRSQHCLYKDVRMLGFQGVLITNLDLPDGFALGRAVSHGYGWIVRQSLENSKCNLS